MAAFVFGEEEALWQLPESCRFMSAKVAQRVGRSVTPSYRRSREEMREHLTAYANVNRVLKIEVEQDVEKRKRPGQSFTFGISHHSITFYRS